MKKSLSLVVTGALVTSVFASSAFAAELTTQQKFDALKAAGIVEGYPGGSAGLDKNITRAEISKVVALLQGLGEDAASSKYKDVAANYWAKGYIGAVTKAGIVNGLGNNLFGPTQNVTVEQVAKIIVESAGLTPKADAAVSGAVSAWAKGYVAAAIEAGLIDQQASYKVAATRGQVFEAAYDLSSASAVSVKSAVAVDEKNIEVTFSDGQVVKQALTTALVAGQATKVDVTYNGKTYSVEVTLQAVKATEAAQSGAKAITVKFNRALSATEKTYLDGGFAVKSSLTSFPVTAKFADDNKSVVLSAVYLPAGDYTVTVKGTDAPFTVKIAASVASKIDITTPALQLADNVDLGVKVFNQFNEDITATSGTYNYITAVNGTRGTVYNVANGKINLVNDGQAVGSLTKTQEGDTINVSAVYPAGGLTTTKALKVVTGSSATSIELGEVQPLKDKTRISAGDKGLVLPLTLKDASGQTIKLTAGTVNLKPAEATAGVYSNYVVKDGLFISISDYRIIDSLIVDKDGVIKFNAGVAGTATIVISNPKAGVSKSINVVVNGAGSIKSFQLGASASIVQAGKAAAFPFVAADQFGNEIKGTDLQKYLDNGSLNISSNIPVTKNVNAKGELELTFASEGYAYVVSSIPNVAVAPTTLNVQVVKAASTVGVNGIKDVATTLENGASVGFNGDNIVLVDSYGGTDTAAANTYNVEVTDGKDVVKYEGGKLVALAPGSASVKVTSTTAGAEAYSFTVNVVESSDISSYSIKSVGTVYAAKTVGAYTKGVKLVGKTSGGVEVALKSDAAPFVSSNDPSILSVSSDNQVTGQKAGKTTITAYNANNKVIATQEVTVSEDAPVAKTAEFKKSEYSVAIGGDVQVALTVKDQYGVEVTPSAKIGSSNEKIATVSGTTVHGVAKGSVTITYVNSAGVIATATVLVG
ncbi:MULTISPECIES: S-layer homology domain-containing protein [Paenibacillus]|nr:MULTISPECIES: S-layer homology domain-containing protein [Paenibacillus]KKC48049.1 hypothetical protein VE23_14580 [Paenibacillus sp. D9]